jgi:uncharacterized membrane protein
MTVQKCTVCGQDMKIPKRDKLAEEYSFVMGIIFGSVLTTVIFFVLLTVMK